MSTLTDTHTDIVPRLEAASERVQRAHKAAASVIFGQDVVIERTLVTILSGGHALLIGVPGLAKTLLVETLGRVLGLDAKRVQFTPDLMPSDIIGSEVLEDAPGKSRAFRLVKGPIFTQLLMADEINRASPRTQSALLQAMQEHHVTVAGARYDIPAPFHVLATQNPLEHEGTYPLPEAQLDRFLLQIDVTYPDVLAERRMLFATTGTDDRHLDAVLTGAELMSIQRLVRQIPVPDKVVDVILKLVRSARPGTGVSEETDRFVAWGPGPRASQALMLAVRAKALIDGRLAPSVDDVLASGGADPQAPHGADVRCPCRRSRPQRHHRAARRSGGVTQEWRTPRNLARILPRVPGSWRSNAKRMASPTGCRKSSSTHSASRRPWRTACMAADAPGRARRSGSSVNSRRATRCVRSTGGARRAPTISTCASASGKRRIPSGCGRICPSP